MFSGSPAARLTGLPSFLLHEPAGLDYDRQPAPDGTTGLIRHFDAMYVNGAFHIVSSAGVAGQVTTAA